MGPSRRKILLYTHALTGGGAERVWALLASGLARRGHDVLLVTDFDASQNQDFVDRAVRRVTLGGNHLTTVLRLARLMKREKPDVSISALSASNLKHLISAALARSLPGAVISYHGYASSEPKLLSQIGFLTTAIMSRLAATTICVSDGLRDYAVKRWGADRNRTIRIYNPVDSGPLPPAANAEDLLARGPTAIAVGRFVPYKQFPLLIRAFARLQRSDARLVILGEGPEKPVIEAEIARLGLQDRVELPGYVREPWKYYAKASCFVLPSSQEPFGLVVVEAMANGLPIVAADCDGPREILADGQFGALTPQGDEASLANAMDAAFANPGSPLKRIERARLFSLDRGLDEYEGLIQQISNRNSSSIAAFPAPVDQPNALSNLAQGAANLRATNAEQVARAPEFADLKPLGRKIAIYTHALTGGGAERAMALLASGLARRGHHVTFVIDYVSADNESYLDPHVNTITLGRGHLRGLLRLKRLLTTEQPDVSISAMGASNLKHAVAAICAGRRKRAILTYHGFFRSEPKFLSRLSYALTPLITRLTARTVAVSSVLRNTLVKTWRADASRTCRVYNPNAWGASTVTHSKAELGARSPVILASGRLTPLKNFNCLIRAFAQVEPENAKLVILGEGPERPKLQNEINRLGLMDRVEMPGYVSEPWSAYERASCLAVSSLSETFGMVVVEALAHGLPVVSSDCYGPREILAHGRYGALVPINDERALAKALSDALADPGDPMPRISRAQMFSLDNSLAHYERMIEAVCLEAQTEPERPLTASA